jgi:hypothetical protein
MLWISGAGGLQSLMFQGIRARFQKSPMAHRLACREEIKDNQ